MKAQITLTHYQVPLTKKQWDRLNERDENGDDRFEEVQAALKKAGANTHHTEYNGHFGSNIFFAIERQRDLSCVLKAIEKLVS